MKYYSFFYLLTKVVPKFFKASIKTVLQHLISMGFYATKNVCLQFLWKKPKFTLFIDHYHGKFLLKNTTLERKKNNTFNYFKGS